MASAAEQLASNLNFSAFAKAEDLKKRIWFTIGALLSIASTYPLPASIPTLSPRPSAEQGRTACSTCSRRRPQRMASSPWHHAYISASIIMRLMTSVIRRWKR